MNKVLVAYFSCSGITEKLAQTLASVVNGDLYKIEPAMPYTDTDLHWQDMTFRPAIMGRVANMKQYGTVFVGFPIWWYMAPTIINTFLESYDFSGKTVIPFATSGTSGVGETDNRLHASCSKKTNWHPAKRFPSNTKADNLKEWVGELSIYKEDFFTYSVLSYSQNAQDKGSPGAFKMPWYARIDEPVRHFKG